MDLKRLIRLLTLPAAFTVAACDAPFEEVATAPSVPGIRVSPQDMPALCRANAADKFVVSGSALTLQEARSTVTGWAVDGALRGSAGSGSFQCTFNSEGAFLDVTDPVQTDPFAPAVLEPLPAT